MNGYGNSVFLRTAWEVSGGVPPVNTVAPAITGTAQEGQIVTCSTGTWTGTPTITFAYQWKRNGSNIGSATNSTYTLVTADVSQSITCQVTATNGSGSASATSNTITPIAALDPDAQAFITAAAITDPTQQAAINTLVVDLKGYSIWTKMKALYPFVGGTASQHKFNLKNPLDTNAAFRLVFNGGWTHSSTGALPNGTNAYANTFLIPSTSLTVDSHSLSYYSRSNILESNKQPIGASNSGYDPMMSLGVYNQTYYYAPNFGASAPTYTETTGLGLFTGTRTAINNAKIYRNGVIRNANTTNRITATLPIYAFAIGCLSISGTFEGYTAKQCAFASIGDGLTDTEAANFYTAVQAFQTTLGRQV
jgi:hypothetical protein